jgi:aminopeptidase N
VLRGAYGPYRANNDLLHYRLDIRVDPVAKTIAGSNTVRFKMLESGSRIQLDLSEILAVDKIVQGSEPLKYTREAEAVFIDFPRPLAAGQTYEIDVHYHGAPVAKGRFGGMSFELDPAGRPWIFTADEDDGCSIWWPCKDQWKDEPQDGIDIALAVPNALVGVANGRLISQVDLHDGYTQWNWRVTYPINSYGVALSIGAYQHFSDTYKNPAFPPLTLDYYALPEDLDKAKVQFAQAKGMLDTFEHYFGEYPYARDGYKLVEVPYAGMEHQSAVAYGNGFVNGYFGDWTGVGISTRFDFIIIHESGHEWFGNSITAADRSDMWIHEGWNTYLEALFVEFQYGHADALRYLNGDPNLVPPTTPGRHYNGVKSHIATCNIRPIVTERGVAGDPPQDQYFKGAMMLNTLRSILDDDPRWFSLIHAFYQHFKYRNIMTEDVVAWWNQQTGLPLTPFFYQYLRRTELRRRNPHGALQVAGRRGRVHHAGEGGRSGALADHPPHAGVAGAEDAARSRRLQRGDRSLLHRREQDVMELLIEQPFCSRSFPLFCHLRRTSASRAAATLMGNWHKANESIRRPQAFTTLKRSFAASPRSPA